MEPPCPSRSTSSQEAATCVSPRILRVQTHVGPYAREAKILKNRRENTLKYTPVPIPRKSTTFQRFSIDFGFIFRPKSYKIVEKLSKKRFTTVTFKETFKKTSNKSNKRATRGHLERQERFLELQDARKPGLAGKRKAQYNKI